MLHCKRKLKKASKVVFALLLASALTVVSVSQQMIPVSAASTLSELEQQQENLKNQKEENDQKINHVA